MALLDLVAFVAARLGDRERAALACDGVEWFSSTETGAALPEHGVYAVQDAGAPLSNQPLVASVPSDAAAVHIARNDPATVLRDIAVDALVLDLYERALDSGLEPACAHTLERVVLAIAATWRDHPEFRAEWVR